MLASKTITVPAGTAESAKQDTKIKLTDGVIHKIEIVFPEGCVNLVKIQMFDGGHQFVPSTEGEFLSGNNVTVEIPEFYEIKGGTRYLTIKTWSPDTTYDHDLEIHIYILPKSVLMPVGAYEGIVEALRTMFIDRFKVYKEEQKENSN